MRELLLHLTKHCLRIMPLAILAALLFGAIGPKAAYADPGWYNLNWQYRKKITINAANVTATQTNFPVLITLGSDTDLAADAQDDADDILFTAADEVTKLSHEIERFDGATGNLTAWVKIPSLSSVTNTEIYMYYGYAGASNQQDAANVWDSDYKMVQHLEETSGGFAGAISDSTINNNDGTDQNAPTFNAGGKMDGAIGFAGASAEYINTGNNTSLNITGTVTVEAWIYPTASQTSKGITAKWQTGSNQWRLFLDSSGTARFELNDGSDPYGSSGATPSLNAWNHVVGVYDGSNVKVYVNTVAGASTAFSGTAQSTTSVVSIANYGGLTTTNAFTGTIDEVRISNSARSTDWIKTSYNNHNNPSAFFTLGAEQNAPTAPTVTTNAATLVEETTATLNGTLVSDGGEACQYSFEWGTTTGVYTDNISWTGSITTGQTFSTNLTGLNKGQKYYFRANVKNTAGTTNGSELDFLTKPDGPVTFSATANSSSQIDLSWTKGAGANRTMVRGKLGSYPANYADGYQVYFNTGTSTSDTGLSANTTHFYRAWSEVTGSQQWSDNYLSASATTNASSTPTVIGGKVLTVNKAMVLAPWILVGAAAVLVIARIIIHLRKRALSRQPPQKDN